MAVPDYTESIESYLGAYEHKNTMKLDVEASTDPREIIKAAKRYIWRAEMYGLRTVDEAWRAGHALHHAKRCCKHGDWIPLLEEARLTRTTAHRYIKLYRSHPVAEAVKGFVTIAAALREVPPRELPEYVEQNPPVEDTLVRKAPPKTREMPASLDDLFPGTNDTTFDFSLKNLDECYTVPEPRKKSPKDAALDEANAALERVRAKCNDSNVKLMTAKSQVETLEEKFAFVTGERDDLTKAVAVLSEPPAAVLLAVTARRAEQGLHEVRCLIQLLPPRSHLGGGACDRAHRTGGGRHDVLGDRRCPCTRGAADSVIASHGLRSEPHRRAQRQLVCGLAGIT